MKWCTKFRVIDMRDGLTGWRRVCRIRLCGMGIADGRCRAAWWWFCKKMIYVELMGYSRPEGRMVEEATLRNLLLDFFVAGCSGDMESALPRSRPVTYSGHDDMAESLSPRLVCSMDAYEILALATEGDWCERSVPVQTFWKAVLAALLLVEPGIVPKKGGGGNGNSRSGRMKGLNLYTDATRIAEMVRPAFAHAERRRVVIVHLKEGSRDSRLTLCIRKC